MNHPINYYSGENINLNTTRRQSQPQPQQQQQKTTSKLFNDSQQWRNHRNIQQKNPYDNNLENEGSSSKKPAYPNMPNRKPNKTIYSSNSHYFGLGGKNPNSNANPNAMMLNSSGSDRSTSPEDCPGSGDIGLNYDEEDLPYLSHVPNSGSSNQIHFLLETWLENEFQTNFKQLSQLICNETNRNCHNNSNSRNLKKQQQHLLTNVDGAFRDGYDDESSYKQHQQKYSYYHRIEIDQSNKTKLNDNEMEPEIFFIRRHGEDSEDTNYEDNSDSGNGQNYNRTPSTGASINNNPTHNANYTQLTNWLLQRRQLNPIGGASSGGGGGATINATTTDNKTANSGRKFPWSKSTPTPKATPSGCDNINNEMKKKKVPLKTTELLLSSESSKDDPKFRKRKEAISSGGPPIIQSNNHWLSERLRYIEHSIMMKKKMEKKKKPIMSNVDGVHVERLSNQQWKLEENLMCLVLSKPDGRTNRESLIYSYPPPLQHSSHSINNDVEDGVEEVEDYDDNYHPELHPSSSTTNISKLVKVCGMFITLNEVMNIITTDPEEKLQSSMVEIVSDNNISSTSGSEYSSNLKDSSSRRSSTLSTSTKNCKYFTSFIIEMAKFESSRTTSNENNNPIVPVMLLIALPCNKFNESDCRSVAELVSGTLSVRFGSLSEAFSSFFHHNSTSGNFSLDSGPAQYLNRILSTLETLIAPKSPTSATLEQQFFANSNVNANSIESLLCLSNTFFLCGDSGGGTGKSERSVGLVTQQLSIEESIALQLSNYLNDFDSLDWLDESIAFYKDGDDIERSLSEHFARCLQLDSVIGSTSTSGNNVNGNGNKSSSSQQNNNNAASLFTENSQLFDLLELDLSSFVVIGSCLFYRGLFVQSHLAPDYLNSIRHTLFSRGLLAASKHQPYDLVYFTRFYPITAGSKTYDSTDISKTQPMSHQFLLVIGYGHLLHCSLINVYCFDRFYYRYLSNDFPTDDLNSKQRRHSSSTTDPNSLQLPSSFAFYVFIKESFRLLCLYLERFGFLHQLSDSYTLSQQFSNSNFDKSFNGDHSRHQKKKKQRHLAVKKRIRRLKSFLGIGSSSNQHQHQNQQQDSDSKQKKDIVKISKSKDTASHDTRSVNLGSLFSNGSKSGNSAQHPGIADRGGATYNNSDDDDSDSDATLCSTSSSISLNSLSESSIRSGATFDQSLSILNCANSIHRFSHDYLPESLICYLSIDAGQQFETFHGPILDNLQDGVSATTSGSISDITGNDLKKQQYHRELMANITSDLCQAIQQLRNTLRKQTELSLRRRLLRQRPNSDHRHGRCSTSPIDGSKGFQTSQQISAQANSTTSGRIIKLRYNCPNSRKDSSQLTTTTTTKILFSFYLLGRCSIVPDVDINNSSPNNHHNREKIGDEFYACFKLNSTPITSSSSTSTSSSSSSAKHYGNQRSTAVASRSLRWSFAGFGLSRTSSNTVYDDRLSSRITQLDGLLMTSNKNGSKGSDGSNNQPDPHLMFDDIATGSGGTGPASGVPSTSKSDGRGDSYEQSRLDFLRIDLDELIQSVRLRNWH